MMDEIYEMGNVKQEVYEVGDVVTKIMGYDFVGTVQAVFYCRDMKLHYVIENNMIKGLLHIFTPKQLELLRKKGGW